MSTNNFTWDTFQEWLVNNKKLKETRLVLSIRESIELKKNIPSNTNTLKMVVQNFCRISLIPQKMLKTELFLMFA